VDHLVDIVLNETNRKSEVKRKKKVSGGREGRKEGREGMNEGRKGGRKEGRE
jgi:hypothetical protein